MATTRRGARAPAPYVDSPSWVQQHMAEHAEATRCGLPMAKVAAWSARRNTKKPICAVCAADAVLSESVPADVLERQRAGRQLRLGLE